MRKIGTLGWQSEDRVPRSLAEPACKMGVSNKREWILFIALLIALFLVFALWSSKEKIEMPVSEQELRSKYAKLNKHLYTSPLHDGPIVEDISVSYVDEDFLDARSAQDILSDTNERQYNEHYRDNPNNEWDSQHLDRVYGQDWPLNHLGRRMRPRIIEVTDIKVPEKLNTKPVDLDSILKKIKKREEMCRRVFEEVYQKPFPKVRPDFLVNPHPRSRRDGKKARNLELDGYNEELKIAFECNGKFHYKPHVFTRSAEDHKYQIWKDRYKRKRCDELGITVIPIPYNIPKRKIREWIEENLPHYQEVLTRLRKRGWEVPERPLQTPEFHGYEEPSVHMGDTDLGDEEAHSRDITYSSSYIDALSN